MQIKQLILLLGALVTGIGCTTANYGLSPVAIQDQKDTYKFKLFVGGFSSGETSDEAVKDDIESYQKNYGYRKYKIIDKHYNLIPSYFEYTVQFTRD